MSISLKFAVKIDRLLSVDEEADFEENQIEDDSMCLTPPAQESPHNIRNALNDHCLRNVFERAEIDLNDLTAIANTCKRFQPIAKAAFKKKYVDDDFTRFKHKDLWRAEEFLRTFGEQIKTISFNDTSDGLDIQVRMILEHCINITKLECGVFHAHSRIALRCVVPQLHELTIFRPDEEIAEIVTVGVAYQLKKLRFVKALVVHLPRMQMPQLVSLQLENVSNIYGLEFFLMNPQIEVLALDENGSNGYKVFQMLQHLPNVKDLQIVDKTSFVSRADALDIIPQLKQLKSFSLHVQSRDHEKRFVSRMVDALQNDDINLETLSLKISVQMNESLIYSLCRFTRIKCLNIEYTHKFDENNDLLIRVLSNLPNLESIHVKNVASLDGIRDALNTANQLKKAHFLVTISQIHPSMFPELPLEEIDAIRQKSGMELGIGINIRMYNNNIDDATIMVSSLDFPFDFL